MNPIEFYNRYTKKIEEEQVYGEAFLRWAYENPLGKLTTELVIKRAFFSRWYGWRMNQKASKKKIDPFIKQFGVNENDFLEKKSNYASFNDFFYRKLKKEARPIHEGENSIIFPADGRHLGFQNVDECKGVFVKGQHFDLKGLLESNSLGEHFKGGSLILSRLCPVDYHRYHFPCSGKVISQAFLPIAGSGVLYSVNPVALAQDLSIFWKNKRLLTLLKTENFGKVAILEIGATCVGSIVSSVENGDSVEKGSEKGYFRFGGSSVITLFEAGRIELDKDLIENSIQNRELYAWMGDRMGEKIQSGSVSVGP